MPSGGTDKTDLGLQVLKSRVFVQQFIERRDLLVPLMAAEAWVPGTGELIIDDEMYDPVAKKWVREAKPPKQAEPSAQESYKAFSTRVTLSKDELTGFVTVSVKHISPMIAQQWVTWLVEDVNDTMRAQDVTEAERSITYLKEQVAATALTDLQAMFFELIQSQTETIMLAQVCTEYLFKTIDPAVVPEEKAEPKRVMICVLGTM